MAKYLLFKWGVEGGDWKREMFGENTSSDAESGQVLVKNWKSFALEKHLQNAGGLVTISLKCNFHRGKESFPQQF